MKSGSFPNDQAEIVFNDVFVEYLEDLTTAEREDVLVAVVRLCTNPVGTHPLSNRSRDDALAGWNTLDVLGGERRVIFASRITDGVGVVEVLCAGPRRADQAYDIAGALVRTGRLTETEVTEIWEALALLDVVAEDVNLDGWDYRPAPAPEGMRLAAVRSGLLDEGVARALSKDEIEAAMAEGWAGGAPDQDAALAAALRRARSGVDLGDVTRIVKQRAEDRCGAVLPRAGTPCIRRVGHPGAHRART